MMMHLPEHLEGVKVNHPWLTDPFLSPPPGRGLKQPDAVGITQGKTIEFWKPTLQCSVWTGIVWQRSFRECKEFTKPRVHFSLYMREGKTQGRYSSGGSAHTWLGFACQADVLWKEGERSGNEQIGDTPSQRSQVRQDSGGSLLGVIKKIGETPSLFGHFHGNRQGRNIQMNHSAHRLRRDKIDNAMQHKYLESTENHNPFNIFLISVSGQKDL